MPPPFGGVYIFYTPPMGGPYMGGYPLSQGPPKWVFAHPPPEGRLVHQDPLQGGMGISSDYFAKYRKMMSVATNTMTVTSKTSKL